MRELKITERDEGGRLDKYLLRYMPKAAKAFVYKMLRKKNITLNGKKAAGNELLYRGDVLALFLSDETIDKFRRDEKPAPVYQEGSLNIVFEDSDLLIINKPVGLLSQPSASFGANSDSVLTRVHAYLNDTTAPALSNRLDRNTSGLIMCAKNLAAVRSLNVNSAAGHIKKLYLAVVSGLVKENGEIISGYYKDTETNTGRISANTEGKKIITRYTPLKTIKKEASCFSLLQIELLTGKSHQIRLHLSDAGYPIIGDGKYGNTQANQAFTDVTGLKCKAQLLHAYRLLFETNGVLEHLRGSVYTAEPPVFFSLTLKKLFNIADIKSEITQK